MSSNTPADDSAAPPAKGKKKLLIIGAVVFVLLLVGGGGAFWMMSKGAAGEESEAAQAESKAVLPTFLPLENMVVNLADTGGERFVQLGITLEVGDDKTADKLKKLMPSVRSTILVLVSQRTAEDLLRLEGKEKLATDIQREAGKALGFKPAAARAATEDEEEATPRPRQNPVRRVLFSSFIIQSRR